MAKACPSSLRQWQSDCTTTAPQVEQQGTEKRALIILIHVWYESTAVIFQDSEDEATHKKNTLQTETLHEQGWIEPLSQENMTLPDSFLRKNG